MQAALINDAIIAYDEGRYEEAFDLFRGVARTPAGDQLRVYNGMYLAASKLGRKDEAAQAFARVVDFGLAKNQLGVMFLFRPGSTLFTATRRSARLPPVDRADRAAHGSGSACVEVSGHTSRTGPEPFNQRLSLMRAQYVKQRLLAGGAGAGEAHDGGRQGFEREQDRHRHGRRARRARPAGRVQGSRLSVGLIAARTTGTGSE